MPGSNLRNRSQMLKMHSINPTAYIYALVYISIPFLNGMKCSSKHLWGEPWGREVHPMRVSFTASVLWLCGRPAENETAAWGTATWGAMGRTVDCEQLENSTVN